jgi:hypothetical protein
VIVVLDQENGLRLRRVRPWDRVAARVRAAALDRELAAGASPDSSVALALHAEHLHADGQRRVLARSLRRVGAAPGTRAARRLVPLDREAVRRAHTELEALAARLASSAPLDVRGVARVRNLLSDGAGPLYQESDPARLRRELAATLASMDPVDGG